MSSPRAIPHRRARWTRFWPNALLGVAAAFGAVALLTVLAASVFGFRVALVASGSMEPALPVGSAALVRSVDADAVSLGDVVTVERPGDIPVVHRVVDIDNPPQTAAAVRDLTLRGDANPVDDPAPYRVQEVGLVLFAVPGAAPVVAGLRSPWMLGAFVVAVGGLVVLALRARTGRDDPADVAHPG